MKLKRHKLEVKFKRHLRVNYAPLYPYDLLISRLLSTIVKSLINRCMFYTRNKRMQFLSQEIKALFIIKAEPKVKENLPLNRKARVVLKFERVASFPTEKTPRVFVKRSCRVWVSYKCSSRSRYKERIESCLVQAFDSKVSKAEDMWPNI